MSEQYNTALGMIPLHFDVPEHHIPLSQFIDSAKSAQDIIEDFNRELFDGQLKYEIRIITPQKGGLIEIVGIGVTGYIIKLFWEFFESDIGKAFIKGLTDHEPTHWAEQLGKKTKELSRELPEVDKQKLCNMVIALMVLGFLQKDTVDLQKTGLSKGKFRTAYSARNRIYEACLKNKEVKGLGFDTSHDFPIKRADFPRFIVDIPDKLETPEAEETKSWKVDIVDLIVHSPNWKRDSNRKWQGSTTEKQDIPFTIEDENFWHHVKIKDIVPDINDNMRVQWARPEHSAKLTNVRVLRVINYNGTTISDALSDAELRAELEDFVVEDKKQDDLFNQHNRSVAQKDKQPIQLTWE